MGRLYDAIRYRARRMVDGVKDFVKPYLVICDRKGNVVITGHHKNKEHVAVIAEIIDAMGDEYGGFVRVGKRQDERIQAQIRESGRANLATVLG